MNQAFEYKCNSGKAQRWLKYKLLTAALDFCCCWYCVNAFVRWHHQQQGARWNFICW